MRSYTKGLHKLLSANRNHENAVAMEKYMRNQFKYFGLKMDDRRDLCKAYMNSLPLPEGDELRDTVLELFTLPERDFQYFAIELLVKCKKQWNEKDIRLFEKLITTKSWWDTVDFLANQVVGPWFKKYPDKIATVTGKWNTSNNIWLQRMSLLFQLKYKQSTDKELISLYILNLSESDEFFVQKAIGWLLREYSKTDAKWVVKFVNENKLKPLSKREALKIVTSAK